MSPASAPSPEVVASIAQEMGIPIGHNPMKPGDLVIHPGFNRMPPKCPVCTAYLYPTQQDSASGNQLFQCLNGDIANAGHYLAVWRVGTQTWGQRPGFEREGWVPPGFDKKTVKAVKTKKAKPKLTKLQQRLVDEMKAKSPKTKGKATLLKEKKPKRPIVRETMPQDG